MTLQGCCRCTLLVQALQSCIAATDVSHRTATRNQPDPGRGGAVCLRVLDWCSYKKKKTSTSAVDHVTHEEAHQTWPGLYIMLLNIQKAHFTTLASSSSSPCIPLMYIFVNHYALKSNASWRYVQHMQ